MFYVRAGESLLGRDGTSRDRWLHFVAHLPGVLFLLDVGKLVDEHLRSISVCHDTERPIIIYDAIMQEFASQVAGATQTARETGAYLKAIERLHSSR